MKSRRWYLFSNGLDVGGRQLTLRELITRAEKQVTAFAPDDPTLLSVRRQPGQRPLIFLLLPLEQTIDPDEVKKSPVALLFIGDPERSVSFDQTRIARLYGLSRAESRVAALLASGYRLDQVAESLDIAYETVRKHLKQIFRKAGTYRQAAHRRWHARAQLPIAPRRPSGLNGTEDSLGSGLAV